jgi:HTH-type transcriptional regulator/antitoxin HigA
MVNELIDEYNPESVSHPGTTLEDVLEERGMSQAELCERTGRPRKTINEILKGKASITPETALQFERVLGIPASFWNNRQRQYDESLAREKEAESLQAFVPWLESFPCIADMVKKNWLPQRKSPVLVLDALLAFFGINSPDEWERVWGKPNLQAALRDSASFKTDQFALAAYLRKAELIAASMECENYDKLNFRAALDAIRALTIEEPRSWMTKIVALCAEAGVAVVFLPLIKGVHVNGATRWMSPNRALLVLSLRGKKEDIFWFSFFHEVAHILLHGKKLVFIESEGPKTAAEEEADSFAQDFLIQEADWRGFTGNGRVPEKEEILLYARNRSISPAIVIGRLQHERLLPQGSSLNTLKRSVAFDEGDSHLG